MGGKVAVLRRTGAVILAGAVIGLVGATPALAADPVVTQPSGGRAYGTVRLESGPASIGPMWLNFGGGEKALAYCIDLHNPVALNRDYVEGTWSGAEVKDLGKVQWVLLHGHPKASADDLFTAAGASPDGIRPDRVDAVLYSATQVAVWHFSDGAELTGNRSFGQVEYRALKKVYDYLTGNATDQPEPAAVLSISPSAAPDVEQGGEAGPFTVTGPSGDISLTVTGGTAVDADRSPVTTVANGGRFYLTRATAGELTASARAEATHSTGRVFLFRGREDAKRQKLILAGTAGDKLTAGAKATFMPKRNSTPSGTPSPSPSVSTSAPSGSGTPAATPGAPGAGGGKGGQLPKTGASVIGPLVGGVALLTAGVAAVILVRRRRMRFTA